MKNNLVLLIKGCAIGYFVLQFFVIVYAMDAMSNMYDEIQQVNTVLFPLAPFMEAIIVSVLIYGFAELLSYVFTIKETVVKKEKESIE